MESSEASLRIQEYLLILRRRWLAASTSLILVVLAILLATSVKKPVYEAQGKLLFKRVNSTSSLTGVGKEIGELGSLDDKTTPIDTETEVIVSGPIVEEAIRQLNLQDKSGNPLKPELLAKEIRVSQPKGADILKISYQNIDPKKAAKVVNTLMDVYLANNIRFNRSEAVAARQFIEKQLPDAEANVRQAEVNLRQFREQNQVFDLEQEKKSIVASIEDLQKQITQTRSQLEDAQIRAQTIRQQLGMSSPDAVATATIVQDPRVQELQRELQQVESELAIQRTRFTEANPIIANLKNKQASLNKLLKERIKKVNPGQKTPANTNLQFSDIKQGLTRDLVALESSIQTLNTQLVSFSQLQLAYQQRAGMLPKLEQRQRDLERKLEASQATYNLLLQKLQEVRLAENQTIGNARIISQATVPQQPLPARRGLYLVTGILLGSIVALGVSLLLEAKDKSLRTVEEAKKLFGFTLLGVIPLSQKSEKTSDKTDVLDLSVPEIILKANPDSLVNEYYWMLQANLKFLSSDKPPKVILVTSSIAQEGKSTVSANLAVAMANAGRKVLLVDADLRLPIQHRIWELYNRQGLSHVIVDRVDLKSAIQEVMPNLDVLSAGVIPPNPIAILDSQRMESLIKEFANSYDFVIVDSPPLNVAPDARTLGRMVDGVLLVVRPRVLDTASANVAKQVLQESGTNVLGIVVNGIIPENEPNGYYYFGKEYNAQKNPVEAIAGSLGILAPQKPESITADNGT
jgi:capsular exopolysaccharide synthesis family protein